MLDLAMAGETLDREGFATILQSDTTAAWRDVSKGGDIGFSFTRSDCDPEVARRDLGLAIEALAATSEIEAALLEATRRLVAGDDTAFEEQQRLHASREAMNERLANLASNE
jgi:DNA primase